MNDELLHDEQWADLARAMDLYDQTGDGTELNQLLVSTMRDIVESLDDYSGMDDEDDREQQFVITLIESELAQMVDVNTDYSWSCGRRRGGKVQPMEQNTHRYSDYLMHLARAKSLDKEKSGFLDKETLERIITGPSSQQIMAELLPGMTENDGKINYRDFALSMLLRQ